MFSKAKSAFMAAFDAIVDFVGSTSFRHRLTVVLVPFGVEIVTLVQGVFSGFYPDGQTRIIIDTAALFVANFLRGKADPA